MKVERSENVFRGRMARSPSVDRFAQTMTFQSSNVILISISSQGLERASDMICPNR
jgi:hypothetical protein